MLSPKRSLHYVGHSNGFPSKAVWDQTLQFTPLYELRQHTRFALPLILRNHQPCPQANLHYPIERRSLGNKRGWPHMLTRQGWLATGSEAEKWYIFIYILSSRWISSVGKALNCRLGGRGFDSLGRINTQGLKTTEKGRYCLCPAMARPSRGSG